MAIPTNTGQDDILSMIFRGIDPSWRAGTTWYISLHTADPGVSGNQTSNEATYTGYSRIAVTKSTGFSLVSHAMQNAIALLWGACTAGSETITHIGIGTSSSGVGSLIMVAAVGTPLAVSPPIVPQFAANTLSFNLT